MELALSLFYYLIFVVMIAVALAGNCATMCILVSKCPLAQPRLK